MVVIIQLLCRESRFIDRLLDTSNSSLTLKNLEKAAHAVNKRIKIELVSIYSNLVLHNPTL